MNLIKRINDLNLELPPAPKPVGIYKPILVIDNFLYISGQGPINTDGSLITGKVGSDLNKNEAKLAARQVGLTMLSTMVNNFKNINQIKRIIKVFGMVNSDQEFFDHPYVINGFSELMVEVFGEKMGIGVRSAVGMTLPQNIAVEIEAQFEINT